MEKSPFFQDLNNSIIVLFPSEKEKKCLFKIASSIESNGNILIQEYENLSNITKDFDILCDALNFIFKKTKGFIHFLVSVLLKSNKEINCDCLCNLTKHFPLSKEDYQNCLKELSQYLNENSVNYITLLNIITIVKSLYQINESKNNHYFSFFPSKEVNIQMNLIGQPRKPYGIFTSISLDLTYFKKLKKNCTLFEAGSLTITLTSDLKIKVENKELGTLPSNDNFFNIYINYDQGSSKVEINVFDNNNSSKKYNSSVAKQRFPNTLKLLNGFLGKVYTICGGFVSSPFNDDKKEMIEQKINYSFEMIDNAKKTLDQMDKIESNVNNFYFFSFNCYNYYQKDSNILYDGTRNYNIPIGNGIFVHQNKNYTSNIDFIGGINEILPAIKILYQNSEELKKCINNDLINKIVSMIFPLYKNNKLNNTDFINVLSYFFEQFPENIFIDLKSIINLNDTFQLNRMISNVINSEIVFNPKIVFKYFIEKDKKNLLNNYINYLTQNQGKYNKRLIIDIISLFNNEMKARNEICCEKHKMKNVVVKGDFLTKMQNLLKLIDLNKENNKEEIIQSLFNLLANNIPPCIKNQIYVELKKAPKNLIELNSSSLDQIFKPDDNTTSQNIEDFKFLFLLYNTFLDELKNQKESNYCLKMEFLDLIENKLKFDYLEIKSSDFINPIAYYLLSKETDKYVESTLDFYFYLCLKTKKNLLAVSYKEALNALGSNNLIKDWKNKLFNSVSNIDVLNQDVPDNSNDINTNEIGKTVLDKFDENKVDFLLILYYITKNSGNELYNTTFTNIIKIISQNENQMPNVSLFFNKNYLYAKISDFLRKKIKDSESIDNYIETYNKFIQLFIGFLDKLKDISDIIMFEIALSLKEIKSKIDEKNFRESKPDKLHKIQENFFKEVFKKLDVEYSTEDQIEQRRIAKIKKEGFKEEKFCEDDDKEEIVYIPIKYINKEKIEDIEQFIEEIRCSHEIIPQREVDFIQDYQNILEMDDKFKDIRRDNLYQKLVKPLFENNNFWQIKNEKDLIKKIKNFYCNDFKRPIISTISDIDEYNKRTSNVTNNKILDYLKSSNDVSFPCYCEKVNRKIFGVIILKNECFYFQGFEINDEYKEIQFNINDIDLFIYCTTIQQQLNQSLDSRNKNIENSDLTLKIGIYLNNKKQYLFIFKEINMKQFLIESLVNKVKDLQQLQYKNNVIYAKKSFLQKIFLNYTPDKSDTSNDYKVLVTDNIEFPLSKILMYNFGMFNNPLDVNHYPYIQYNDSKSEYKNIINVPPYDKNKIDYSTNNNFYVPELFYLPEIYPEGGIEKTLNISSTYNSIKELKDSNDKSQGNISLKLNSKSMNIIDVTGSTKDTVNFKLKTLIYGMQYNNDQSLYIVSDSAIALKIITTGWFATDNSQYHYYYAHFTQKYFDTYGRDGKDIPNYLSNNIVFSENKKYCFVGGLQDGYLIYFHTSNLIPLIINTEIFNKDKNVISALTLVEQYMNNNYLVCGDTFGNIILFIINSDYCKETPSNKSQGGSVVINGDNVFKEVKKISGHYREISSLCVNSTKDILVTAGEDYCINLFSFPDLRILKSIKHNYNTSFVHIFNYPYPSLITFANKKNSYHEGTLRLLTLNGKEVKSHEISKFNHPKCVELYGSKDNISKIIYQSDHQTISICNIDKIESPIKSKSFNGTNNVSYEIGFSKDKNSIVMHTLFGVRISSKGLFDIEKLSNS